MIKAMSQLDLRLDPTWKLLTVTLSGRADDFPGWVRRLRSASKPLGITHFLELDRDDGIRRVAWNFAIFQGEVGAF
jgi:hypothetical protein